MKNRVLYVSKGILRLTTTVLVCLFFAALGYMAIVALIMTFPPHTLR